MKDKKNITTKGKSIIDSNFKKQSKKSKSSTKKKLNAEQEKQIENLVEESDSIKKKGYTPPTPTTSYWAGKTADNHNIYVASDGLNGGVTAFSLAGDPNQTVFPNQSVNPNQLGTHGIKAARHSEETTHPNAEKYIATDTWTIAEKTESTKKHEYLSIFKMKEYAKIKDDIIDVDEVKRMLRIEYVEDVYQLLDDNELPFFKVGKKIMFSRHDVYIWCEKQMNKNYSKEIYGN